MQSLLLIFSTSLMILTLTSAPAIDPQTATSDSIQEAIRQGARCRDIIQAYLDRIRLNNYAVHAVTRVNHRALDEARVLDDYWTRQRRFMGPLHCAPLLVKDNYDVKELPTSNGAIAMLSMMPEHDADAVRRLKQAGAVVIGKANMAYTSDSGINSESEVGGQCRNPFDRTRTCYGSSGGSGAGLAANFAVIALGTDTEGSILGPSSGANVFGIRARPTDVNKDGVYPAFSRQDVSGPMSATALDMAKAMDALLSRPSTNLLQNLASDSLKGVRVGRWALWFQDFELPGLGTVKLNPDVKRATETVLSQLHELGAEIKDVAIDASKFIDMLMAINEVTSQKVQCSRSCMVKDVDAYLTQYATRGPYRKTADLMSGRFRKEYLDKVNKSLHAGDVDRCGIDTPSAPCYKYAQASKQVMASIMTPLFNSGVDVIAVPTWPNVPHPYGLADIGMDGVTGTMAYFTALPAINIPAGFSSNNPPLPVGMTLTAKSDGLDTLFKIALAYDRKFPKRRPTPNL